MKKKNKIDYSKKAKIIFILFWFFISGLSVYAVKANIIVSLIILIMMLAFAYFFFQIPLAEKNNDI